MRNWRCLIVAALCLPSQCWTQARTTPPPTVQPASRLDSAPSFDRDAFTITRWDLNVTIDPQLGTLGCRGKIILRNDSDTPQDAVSLQISSTLRWSSIRAGGNSIEFSSTKLASDIDHSGAVNEAVALPRQPVAPGSTLEMEIGYAGYIRQTAARLERIGTPLNVAERSDWDQIGEGFTGVRGVGNVVWYPVSIAPSRLGEGTRLFDSLARWKARHAESQFHAVYELRAAYTLLANDSRIVVDGTGQRSTVESNLPRMGTETPFFVAGKYASIETKKGKVFCFSPDEAVARKYASVLGSLESVIGDGATASSSRRLGASPTVSKSGAPMPGKESAIALIELPEGFVQFESGPTMLLPLHEADEKQMQQMLIHTITHGAFYSRRAWIYEGLAHYAQARLLEQQYSRKTAIDFIEQRRGALAIAESDLGGSASSSQSLVKASDEVFYRSKAMFVWWMLHDMIGDAALEKALAEYRPDEDKEPSYIQRLLEAASGRNLEWFFGDWVYRDRGLPDFRITSVYPRENLNGGYMVTVSVENLGNAAAEVPVSVRTKDGEIRTRLELLGKDKASARIAVRDRPLEATVNDGSVPESDPNNNSYTVPSPP